jgi:hypothetical protein
MIYLLRYYKLLNRKHRSIIDNYVAKKVLPGTPAFAKASAGTPKSNEAEN